MNKTILCRGRAWGDPARPQGVRRALWILLLTFAPGPQPRSCFSFQYPGSVVLSIFNCLCLSFLCSFTCSLFPLPSKRKAPLLTEQGHNQRRVPSQFGTNLCPPHLYLCPFCRTETCPSTPSTEFPPLLFKIQAEPRSRSCHSRDAHWDAGIGSHLSKGGYQKVPKVTWSKVRINWASYTETVTVDFKVPSTLRLYSHCICQCIPPLPSRSIHVVANGKVASKEERTKTGVKRDCGFPFCFFKMLFQVTLMWLTQWTYFI